VLHGTGVGAPAGSGSDVTDRGVKPSFEPFFRDKHISRRTATKRGQDRAMNETPPKPFGFQMTPAIRRLGGAGTELATGALGLGGVGYLIDRRIGWQPPWLGIAGVFLGFALGMYRLIRVANELERDMRNRERERRRSQAAKSPADPVAREIDGESRDKPDQAGESLE